MNLPISFYLNGPDRIIRFLDESNRIEGITEVDYRNPQFQIPIQGHFGALVDSQQLALDQKPLTHRKIREWQAMLTREQKLFGHEIDETEIGHFRNPSLPKNVRIGRHIPPDYNHVPTLITDWIERVNERLKDQEKLKDDAELCKCLGESFQEFEAIHPFADGNGRTGRLIANYIETFCRRPIIVFTSEIIEKHRYYEAHYKKEDMTRFMAGKVQEVIFGLNGQLLFRAGNLDNPTGIYKSAEGDYQESYDWHVLNPLFEQKP